MRIKTLIREGLPSIDNLLISRRVLNKQTESILVISGGGAVLFLEMILNRGCNDEEKSVPYTLVLLGIWRCVPHGVCGV